MRRDRHPLPTLLPSPHLLQPRLRLHSNRQRSHHHRLQILFPLDGRPHFQSPRKEDLRQLLQHLPYEQWEHHVLLHRNQPQPALPVECHFTAARHPPQAQRTRGSLWTVATASLSGPAKPVSDRRGLFFSGNVLGRHAASAAKPLLTLFTVTKERVRRRVGRREGGKGKRASKRASGEPGEQGG
jgi:hypothetical protein